MVTTILVLILCIGFISFSKNVVLGRFLYFINNSIEIRLANLKAHTYTDDPETYSYLTNNQPEKPVMLLLHGLSADKTIWLKFAKYANKNFNLFIPDMLGHGDIPYSTDQCYSSYSQADYIRRFIKAINIKGPITIVGNSMGGMVGAILCDIETMKKSKLVDIVVDNDAYEYFENAVSVKNLVLLDPAGAKGEFASNTVINKLNPFIHKTMEESFEFFEGSMEKPPFIPPSALAYIADNNYIKKQEQYRHLFKDFFNPIEFFDGPIQSRSQKVTLVWGENDQLLPISECRLWEHILSCDSHILPGIGHMPMVECPKHTYSLIHNTRTD